MDVGRPAFDRVGQNDVDEPDDRCFVGLLGQGVDVELFGLIVEYFEVAAATVLVEVFHDLLEFEGVGGAVVFVDGATDCALGRDDRLDVVAGHELDVIHREHVGGVQHGDGDLGAGLGHRHDGVLAGDVGGNDLHHRFIYFNLGQADGRDAKVLGEEPDQVFLVQQAHLDQIGTQSPTLLALFTKRLSQLLLGDFPCLDQEFAQPIAHAPP